MLRSLAVLLRQAGQAALAAAMAVSASAAPRLATSARWAPVAGSVTAKRLGPLTHWPLTRASVLSRVGSVSYTHLDVYKRQALDMLASSVKMARSGLGKGDKPIGAFLFSGPTGVGKTEAAKQLAYIMGIELIRFDMSEYMEQHAVSRLIGAPPGYVGFDQGGLLTEAITKKPHCVLLLDEVEKAHPAIFNVLLQVMDHGTLTDRCV